MENKEIYLSLLPKYELAVDKLINSKILDKKINYNEDLIEIKINMDYNKEESRTIVTKEITDIVMNIVKTVILKEYIHKTYDEIYNEHKNNIYSKALEVFEKKEILIRESIFYRVDKYIENNNYIDIDGFVKFRMKELIGYISNIADSALEEYLVKKDYDEFISVLKYFIKVQDTKIDTLKIYIRKDNSFILYDKNDNIIENENDKELMDMFIKENLNYEDFLISTLLSLCPNHIIIYDSLKTNSSREMVDTIKAIFENRVEEMQKS
ncbi:sporulation protein [[Clostridium] sordellii]|uniref:putative sporulation protein YtxC n=1 Tax=Paraclostridium sordellii TaxID=1505 RepID=UPI0005E7FC82|nr:putative sporulation protein YtxC [Paeniclostridium sordellii]MBS6024142.1 putative sporulation protein YtxC [Paeniclostridium sordellii]CEN77016.1 sporulation protein [[Clostridium] sordellii] [Paeniclostridium sordellii]CEN90397.1 sporulation protein [[Clostridium] sordellii] [Paeniclostridium sordellii]CEQ13589.1 sporulation protein [[Clostridium] sordellii] [Paeniclostridium sordellii]